MRMTDSTTSAQLFQGSSCSSGSPTSTSLDPRKKQGNSNSKPSSSSSTVLGNLRWDSLHMGRVSPSTTLLSLSCNVPSIRRMSPYIREDLPNRQKFTLSTAKRHKNSRFLGSNASGQSTPQAREFTAAQAAAQLLGLNSHDGRAACEVDSDSPSAEHGESERRQKRRKAHEIVRMFSCCFCSKSYGTLSALTLHLRCKHPKLVRKMMGLAEGEYLQPIHSRSVAAFVNNAMTDKHIMPSCSAQHAMHNARQRRPTIKQNIPEREPAPSTCDDPERLWIV
eukprot:gb/GECG01013918.1/.p1 GENE.gb/GECG01013918.1/~~gb/GECG01013918.1/.p1  ORF type:complete len:279 (+),score=25.33 gb/GECG01013918.1/:1-837(+)